MCKRIITQAQTITWGKFILCYHHQLPLMLLFAHSNMLYTNIVTIIKLEAYTVQKLPFHSEAGGQVPQSGSHRKASQQKTYILSTKCIQLYLMLMPYFLSNSVPVTLLTNHTYVITEYSTVLIV